VVVSIYIGFWNEADFILRDTGIFLDGFLFMNITIILVVFNFFKLFLLRLILYCCYLSIAFLLPKTDIIEHHDLQ